MTEDLLLEVGCEEIPARAIPPVLAELREKFERLLAGSRLNFERVEALGSARRLVVHITGLEERQARDKVLTLGPPESIAFKDGRPSKAMEGFARKSGVAVDALGIFETERGRYVGFEQEIEGKPVAEVLSAEIPGLIRSLYFPKGMYWIDPHQRFARPVRWVVALYGGEIVPLELFGLRAGAVSEGHRVLGSRAVVVTGFRDYLEKLEADYVIVQPEVRRKKIETELERAASSLGGRIIPDAKLLEEVIYLNEYPTVVTGEFERRFLDLPREVLVTVMKEHQKYFAVEAGDGRLLPVFLAVMNTKDDPRGLIRKGHERVLKGRLTDALFFREVDARQTLEARVAALDSIVFHKEMGTYADKIARMERLAEEVNRVTGAEIASEVLRAVVRQSKADLTTSLVGEFPDLEGIVGGLYARSEGAAEEVWRAIYDQYRPSSLEDRSPDTPAGAVLALTDRLDTLAGCFAAGLIPTGSEDPLGLRRHMQGVIKILFDHRLGFSLERIVRADGRLDAQAAQAFKGFYEDRLRHVLDRRGFAYDEINAVLATGSDSPADVLARVEALHGVRRSPDLIAIAAAFKRIKNILKQSAEKGESLEGELAAGELEPEEAALAEVVGRTEPEVRQWARSGEYTKALEKMASLRGVVDRFFDKILVMHPDPAIRRRRLVLLGRLFDTFRQVADISEVVVSG